MHLKVSLIVASFACAICAQATNLNGEATADNAFTAYISTVSGVQGTQIGSGNNWASTFAVGPATLNAGQDYYLQIFAQDFGAPDGFLGEFTLDSTDHQFANGTQDLLTDTTNWTVSATDFANNMVAPTSYGANGVSPWGAHPPINSSALWIWTSNQGNQNVYFETKITANSVPEPATLSLAGMAALAWLRRRKA